MPTSTGQIWGIEIGGSKLQIFSLQNRTIVDRWTRKLKGTADAPLIRAHIAEGLAELLREGRARLLANHLKSTSCHTECTREEPGHEVQSQMLRQYAQHDNHHDISNLQRAGISGHTVHASQPVAVGVGFGGPVDWHTGQILLSHQIAGWEGFSIRDWIAGIVNCPVFVENDSNVAALAEATVGAGRGLDPVLYFNMGSGVGGGLVVAGRIYHGAPPGEVEFGHLRLRPGGSFVEDNCSGWAVDRLIDKEIQQNPQSRLASLCAGMTGGQAIHLRPAIEAGDDLAIRLVERVAADIGFALSHAVHLFHPAVVVMGGGLSLVGEPLRSAIERHTHAQLMTASLPGPPVKLAQVGEDAVPVGAAINAEYRTGDEDSVP
ncbi:MAG: ROK family protein [Tepidisphaeraceae bacterium]